MTVHSDHLLDHPLDGGGFLLYNMRVKHPLFNGSNYRRQG